MKRFLVLIMVLVMGLSAVACGAKADSSTNSKTQTDNSAGNTAGVSVGLSPVEAAFHPTTSPDAPAYATIKINNDVKMDDETAWLGLCPAGVDYRTELEADETDIIWFSLDYREDSDPYVFACDFSSVDDGTYALVVATSDDENVGYVIIQLEMTKKGDKLSFDYSNAKLKERP